MKLRKKVRKESWQKMSGTTGIEDDFEKLCVEESSDFKQSDAQCPVCGLTYFGDDTKSIWVCCDSSSVSHGWILNVLD